jgi:hypothetical protein
MTLGLPINKDSNGIRASYSKACSIEFRLEINKDDTGMWASSYKSCSIEFLNRNQDGFNNRLCIEFLIEIKRVLMEGHPPKACSIEFRIEHNKDSNVIGASNQ